MSKLPDIQKPTLLMEEQSKQPRVPCYPAGPKSSGIAVVGHMPSASDCANGEPFTSRIGDDFNKVLRQAGIPRNSIYLTTLSKYFYTKWVFPKTMIYKSSTGVHTSDAFGVAVDRLLSELKSMPNLRVILVMENPALYALTERWGITDWRGSMLKPAKSTGLSQDIWIVPTRHPHTVWLDALNEHLMRMDFTRAVHLYNNPDFKLRERRFVIAPTEQETFEHLDYMYKVGKSGVPISFDIETAHTENAPFREVSCISFACSEDWAVSIPFMKFEGGSPTNYFLPPTEVEIWTRIAKILEDPSIRKVGQNLIYDSQFLLQRLGIVTTSESIDDTMIAHKTLYPDMPMGLGFICTHYTDMPFHKGDGKTHIRANTISEGFWIYNAKDSLICQETMPKLRRDLTAFKNLSTYEAQVKLIGPCTYMGTRGYKLDLQGLNAAHLQAQEQTAELQEQINSLVGSELNPNSPKQVKEFLYGRCGLPPYKQGGEVTTNEKALKKVSIKKEKRFELAATVAKLILAYRKIKKLDSTYYQVAHKDGRLVCSYKPVTSTGRLASAEDAFGFGMNMQNQPYAVRKFFIADEGYLMFNVDLSQADNRSVAFIANDANMMRAFEEGLDIHSMTASLVFGIPTDEIKQMDKEKVMCPLGGGDQTHRYWGKKCNHSLNFGMGTGKFSDALEIPLGEATDLWKKYHRAYPSVQGTYQANIKRELYATRTLQNCFGRRHLFLGRFSESLYNEAFAFPPQSNTADCIDRQGLIPLFYDPQFREVDLQSQVHDSITFQLPLSMPIAAMLEVLYALKKSLEQPLVWNGRKFILPAEFSAGWSLGTQVDLALSNSEVAAAQLTKILQECPHAS